MIDSQAKVIMSIYLYIFAMIFYYLPVLNCSTKSRFALINLAGCLLDDEVLLLPVPLQQYICLRPHLTMLPRASNHMRRSRMLLSRDGAQIRTASGSPGVGHCTRFRLSSINQSSQQGENCSSHSAVNILLLRGR